MFDHDPRHRPHFGFFGPHRRWADDDPAADWFFGRFGRRVAGGGFGGLPRAAAASASSAAAT